MHTMTISEFKALDTPHMTAVFDWLNSFEGVEHLRWPDCVTYVSVDGDLVRVRVKEWAQKAGGGIELGADGKPLSITREYGSWSDGVERPWLGHIPDGSVHESWIAAVMDEPLPALVAEAFGAVTADAS